MTERQTDRDREIENERKRNGKPEIVTYKHAKREKKRETDRET